ncbi:hypothetical protein A0H81_01161 [Grifola frondosa]|uniref:Uncharacterized protein n=1 Tax=Grifola frondosa TaxID=5627 RepID=A0A1C7MPV2_GRIFR|nr:hypothetical protein A0H81_01161 [Grifola frondosa]
MESSGACGVAKVAMRVIVSFLIFLSHSHNLKCSSADQKKQTRSRTAAAKEAKKDQDAPIIPTIKIPPMRSASGVDASAVRKLPPLPFVLIETTSQTSKSSVRSSRETKNLPPRADEAPSSSPVSTKVATKRGRKGKKLDKGKEKATSQSVEDSILGTASSVVTSPLDSGLPSAFTPPSINTPFFPPSPLEGSLSLPSASQVGASRNSPFPPSSSSSRSLTENLAPPRNLVDPVAKTRYAALAHRRLLLQTDLAMKESELEGIQVEMDSLVQAAGGAPAGWVDVFRYSSFSFAGNHLC